MCNQSFLVDQNGFNLGLCQVGGGGGGGFGEGGSGGRVEGRVEGGMGGWWCMTDIFLKSAQRW